MNRITVRAFLRCSARSASRTLEAGLLGTRKRDAHVVPWSVAVIASCAAGVTRYQAAASDSPGRGGMRVHPGDVISLTKGPGKSGGSRRNLGRPARQHRAARSGRWRADPRTGFLLHVT